MCLTLGVFNVGARKQRETKETPTNRFKSFTDENP
jgi:hypothetical protein